MPTRLQKQAVLRIHYLGFFWVNPKELRIELVSVANRRTFQDQRRIVTQRTVRRNVEFFRFKVDDAVHAFDDIRPKLANVLGAGKSSGHANDRDSVLVHLIATRFCHGRLRGMIRILSFYLCDLRSDCRQREQLRNRNVSAKHVLKTSLELYHVERRPTQFLEWIVDADFR